MLVVLVDVPARPDAEVQAPVADHVDSRGDVREHGRVAVGVAGDHQPEPQARRLGGEAARSVQPSKQGPSRLPLIGAKWSNSQACSMTGMLSASRQTQDRVVGRVLRGGLDTETESGHVSPLAGVVSGERTGSLAA